MSNEGSQPMKRLGVTLLIPLGVLAVNRFSLPGIHPEVLQLDSAPGPMVNLFSFGLNPAISAALLVEVAAFVVPRWRPLRHGGPAQRDRLGRAALLLTVVFACIQAFFIGRWLERWTRDFPWLGVAPDSFGGRLVVCASIATGAVVAVGLTRLLDARGIGSGFSVLLAAFYGERVVEDLRKSFAQHPPDDGVLRSLATPLLALVGLAFVTAWRRRGEPQRPTLPAPTSSVHPLIVTVQIAALAPQLAALGLTLPAALLQLKENLPAQIAILVLATCAGAWLFSRPALVAPQWRRALGAGADARSRRAFWVGLTAALAYLGVLGAATRAIVAARVALDAVLILTISCVILDVASEWRFRQAHGEVSRVWAEHRLYVVDVLLGRLEAAGIPAFPRALRHRSLLAFLGPYIPVEVLVPAARAADAAALIEGQRDG